MGLLVVTLGHVTVSRCQITSLVPTATFLDPAVIQKAFFFFLNCLIFQGLSVGTFLP